jgi:hypothetical protein
MRLIVAAAAFLAVAALASDAAAQHPMRPGRWEITMQMAMPNMPMQMPAMKSTQCITQAQLDAPDKALPAGPNKNANECKVSEYKQAGDIVTWKIACSGQQAMTGSGELRFTGDTYEGVMQMEMDQQQITMKYSGKRVGDCAP